MRYAIGWRSIKGNLMKVFAISDLHLSLSNEKPMDIFGDAWENYLDNIKKDWKEKVCDDDIVIMAGDLSWAMKIEDFQNDLKFFEDLPGKKIIVRGNHDYWWSSLSKVKQVLPENFFVLQNNAIKIDNYVFCGTRGWSLPDEAWTEEDDKIYKREQIRLSLALKSATELMTPNDKLVVILHYPPFNFKNTDNEFMVLLKQANPFAVVFGHIHNSRGKYRLQTVFENTKYFLTSCDLIENKLVLIE